MSSDENTRRYSLTVAVAESCLLSVESTLACSSHGSVQPVNGTIKLHW